MRDRRCYKKLSGGGPPIISNADLPEMMQRLLNQTDEQRRSTLETSGYQSIRDNQWKADVNTIMEKLKKRYNKLGLSFESKEEEKEVEDVTDPEEIEKITEMFRQQEEEHKATKRWKPKHKKTELETLEEEIRGKPPRESTEFMISAEEIENMIKRREETQSNIRRLKKEEKEAAEKATEESLKKEQDLINQRMGFESLKKEQNEKIRMLKQTIKNMKELFKRIKKTPLNMLEPEYHELKKYFSDNKITSYKQIPANIQNLLSKNILKLEPELPTPMLFPAPGDEPAPIVKPKALNPPGRLQRELAHDPVTISLVVRKKRATHKCKLAPKIANALNRP